MSRKHRPDETRLKVPTILDNIVKDATVYFLVIFGTQVLVECFVLFAPVSGTGRRSRTSHTDPVEVDLSSPTSKVREFLL